MVKKTSWNLKPGFYPDGQYIYEYLNSESLPESGMWKIQIGLATETIIELKFFILPSEKQVISLLNKHANALERIFESINFNQFWSFNSICIQNVQTVRNDLIRRRFNHCEKTHWSTFYPDEASDLKREHLNI